MADNRKSLLDAVLGGVPSNKLVLGEIEYTVDEIVGSGGSAIVYKGFYDKDGTQKPVIVKEIYPKNLGEYTYRKPNGEISFNLDLSNDEKTAKKRSLENFIELAKLENKTLDILQLAEDGRNIDTRLFDSKSFVIANNTAYTVFCTENGDILGELLYKRNNGESLELSAFTDICECVVRILEALKPIHDKGYLNLDIAPDNIHISRYDMGGSVKQN
jgi:serine/threonine protein kinase